MKMYNGEEKCAGCGISGKLKPRVSKAGLCSECRNDLLIAKQLRQDYQPEHYAHVELRWYSLSQYDDIAFSEEVQDGPKVEGSIIELIKSMDRGPGFKTSGPHIILRSDSSAHASNRGIIRTEYAEALKKLCDALANQQRRFKERMKKADEIIKVTRKQEQNKIYNEGVEYGKSLLIQLNKGEVSLQEFDKQITKY